MARPPAKTHWLRPNEGEWSPAVVGVFDTETVPEEIGTRTLHRLRLWAADVRRRDVDDDHQRPGHRSWGHSGQGVADWIETQLVGVSSMWLYAHNLSFDLTTTRLLEVLLDRGWRLGGVGLTDRNPWFRLRRRSKHLVLADSWSWLPVALEKIGELTGVRKPALPTWDDDDAAWLTRCFGDVDTTMAALTALLDWWDAEGLGRWSITGASTGWNAMRHKSPPRAFLIDPTPAARTFERQAIWGGRRDVWRTGTLKQGPYLHLDITRAHGSVAEHLAVPGRRVAPFGRLALGDRVWDRSDLGLIAHCRVRCDRPHWPLRWQGNVWWPVGTFDTVLAGPELALARELGELVSVGAGWRYRLTHDLHAWARWANRLAAGETPTAPAVAQLAAKAWGRSVVGKFAAHASTATREGVALSRRLTIGQGWTMGPHARATVLDIGGERWWITHTLDADNCFPAVLAYVESHVRARMTRLIDFLGPTVVVACDTDGLIVDLPRAVLRHSTGPKRAGRPPSVLHLGDLLAQLATPFVAPLVIRADEAFTEVVVDGAQQLVLDGRRQAAGIPRSALEMPDGTFRAKTWPKLRWQMRQGSDEGYVQPTMNFSMAGAYVRRWVGAGGQCTPPEAAIDTDGRTVMVAWGETSRAPGDLALAEVQHPSLARL